MHDLDLVQLSQALQKKEFSCVELMQHVLQQIQTHAAWNAFISVDAAGALQAANKADKELQAGGPKKLLTGIPMAIKDVFCTTSLHTTCASKMLANFQSPYDATLVSNLKKHGAIMVGKTNMDEFAMGSSNENSYFGPVKNPWDTTKVPGGSSGGSAAAVAGRLVPFAIGSDTGGSIRQPAAFCGISGIKPTYGLVSRYGMVAYASSLDQGGPMARSARSLAAILQAMGGHDPLDSTSINKPLPDYAAQLDNPLSKLRIGLPSCFFQPQVDAPIQQAIRTAVHTLESLGATVVELDLTLQPLWVPTYYVIACAEASSNLSRYDGLRFGHSAAIKTSLMDHITASRSEGFGPEVQRRIVTGTYVLSSGHFDAYYLQAQKIRRLIQQEFLATFQKVDVLIGPTTPTCAFTLGDQHADPVQNYLSDVFTVGANLAGLPALSIPVGFANGLPIGLQCVGTHFSEGLLLNIAHQYQQQTNWHTASPTL